MTDYVISVSRAIGQWVSTASAEPGSVAALIVRHVGGRLTLEGREINFYDEQVLPFQKGHEYVLFLKYDSKEKRYILAAAEWGVFEVMGDKVSPIEAARDFHRAYKGWSTAAFLAEVENLRAIARR